MLDVRAVLRTERPAAYGVNIPVVELLRTRDEEAVVGHLGPDPLRDDWDITEASRRLADEPDRPVVAALLDQRCVAGFGNLWANELCFLRGHNHGLDGVRRRHCAARAGCTSIAPFGHRPGAMQVTTKIRRKGEQHWVSGRAGRPCLRCGTTVHVVAEASNDPERRRTWWVSYLPARSIWAAG